MKVLFVTPEWLFSSNKPALVKEMSESGKLGLVAIDKHILFLTGIHSVENMVNW